MNCEEIRTVIPRYLAGESNEGEAVALEEHIESCQQCAAELEADQQVDARLRAAMLEDEPDASAVVRRVIERIEQVPWWRRTLAVGMLRFATVASVIALALMIGRAVYIHQMEKGVAMAAAHDHYMDLVVLKRTDWAYSGESSARFVQSNFPGTPGLVNLITPAGGALEKVRFCNLNGTHYAHFVFSTPGGDVSVFLRAKAPGEGTYSPEVFHDKPRGLEVADFSSRGFVGAVVGQDGIVSTGTIAAQEEKVL